MIRTEILAEMKETADAIFSHPELSLQEKESSRRLAEFLERWGFTVSWGTGGFETAFTAEWGAGEPVIGFLAEYDALPGLQQECVPRQSGDGGPGHGCGHHLLGTACAGAAAALKERMEEAGLPGTLRVYGCPAEEIVVGKIRMNEEGVFDDLAAAVTWHPFDRNRVSYDIWQAQDIKNYKFFGTAAHASKHPEMGRSALDAAELMNVSVNYLREHVADDVRMHYTYTNTDGPANIVPSFASTNYFIRSGQWERTADVSGRVDDCARGAALMTGTRVEIERVTCNKEMKVSRTLAEMFYEEMGKIPVPSYTEEELAFAAAITENAGLSKGQKGYFTGLEPLEDQPVPLAIGTDVSDVSHTVPTIMLSAACMCRGTPLHHWAAAAQAGMSIGRKGMEYAAECMAAGAYRLVTEPEILEHAWREHRADGGSEARSGSGSEGEQEVLTGSRQEAAEAGEREPRPKKIILGSASPRRRELLAQMGVEFEVRVSGKEEVYRSTVPEEIVKELALMKAENTAEELTAEEPGTEKTGTEESAAETGGLPGADRATGGHGRDRNQILRGRIVLGADTVVVLDDKILGKPADEADAFRILRGLQGRSHMVYTGVAVLDFGADGRKRVYSHAAGTRVYVHSMSDEEIRGYIATGEPLDKAGAYGIQGRFAPYIDRIEGDYYNVVGLPVSYVYQILKELGAV